MRSRAVRRTVGLLGLVGLLSLLGCGATFQAEGRTVRAGGATFVVGALPGSWRRVDLGGPRVAFHHAAGGVVTAGADCAPGVDVALEVLTQHLLIGFAPRRIVAQRAAVLDGRRALETQVVTELDGVPVAVDLVVVRRDACLFDLQLVSAPGSIAARRVEFQQLWRGFRVASPR